MINDTYGPTPTARPPTNDRPIWVSSLRSGGRFILDAPTVAPAIWGSGSDVLWAEGEALMLAGDQGVGKTTIGQQLTLGRCGLLDPPELFGYPIAPGRRRTLYLAMDRPAQAARSMRRMVGEAWRDELDDRLVVWPGPPPADLATSRGLLTEMCRQADADTVVVDSLKDAATKLTDDETGAMWNLAYQLAIQAGVQVLHLHHNRKTQPGSKDKIGLDKIYGSTWLTAGCGSVFQLVGEPGDPLVRMWHVKQPAAEIGPLALSHDHNTGHTQLVNSADLDDLIAAAGSISAKDAARALYSTENPTRSQVEKVRRRLDNDPALVVTQTGGKGGSDGSTPTLWGRP